MSEASSAAQEIGTGAKAPEGPRPGETLSPSVIPASLSPTPVPDPRSSRGQALIGDPVKEGIQCTYESSVSESLSLLLSVIPDPDRGSSCRGGISCRLQRPPSNGQRHETEGRMRCGHYRGGVPRARDKRTRDLIAPPHGACGRGCARARPSHPLSFPQVFSGNPGSLCSCRGGISCRPKRRQRNGQRHEACPCP